MRKLKYYLGDIWKFSALHKGFFPYIKLLEGVSLNCVSLNKKISSTTSPVVSKIALAFGGFKFAALTSKVAH